MADGMRYTHDIDEQWILEHIDKLFNTIGIHKDYADDEKAFENLFALMTNGDIESCISALQAKYLLPVSFNIHCESVSNLQAGELSPNAFAAVSLPKKLPRYGSAALQGYPIDFYIKKPTEKAFFATHFSSYIYAIVHELSHVILNTLGDPLWEDEKHVDLTVMALGFIQAIEHGKEWEENKNEVHRLGYLSDDEFYFAKECLERRINDLNVYRNKIESGIDQVASLASEILFYCRKITELQRISEELGCDDDRSRDRLSKDDLIETIFVIKKNIVERPSNYDIFNAERQLLLNNFLDEMTNDISHAEVLQRRLHKFIRRFGMPIAKRAHDIQRQKDTQIEQLKNILSICENNLSIMNQMFDIYTDIKQIGHQELLRFNWSMFLNGGAVYVGNEAIMKSANDVMKHISESYYQHLYVVRIIDAVSAQINTLLSQAEEIHDKINQFIFGDEAISNIFSEYSKFYDPLKNKPCFGGFFKKIFSRKDFLS